MKYVNLFWQVSATQFWKLEDSSAINNWIWNLYFTNEDIFINTVIKIHVKIHLNIKRRLFICFEFLKLLIYYIYAREIWFCFGSKIHAIICGAQCRAIWKFILRNKITKYVNFLVFRYNTILVNILDFTNFDVWVKNLFLLQKI